MVGLGAFYGVHGMTIMPSRIDVIGPDGKNVSVDTTTWTPEFWVYMLKYAWGVRRQRCTANVEPANQAAAREALHASMKRGEIPSGGGGGAQGTAEERAWVEYFRAGKVKISGKEAGIRSLQGFWEQGCRQALIAGGAAPTTQDVTDALPTWRAWMEAEDDTLKALILAERVKSGEVKAKAFTFVKQ